MRLPDSAHTSRPWRIHDVAGDFDLVDVWALPARGGPDDFPRLVQALAAGDPTQSAPLPVRALWALRWKLGELLGLDDEFAAEIANRTMHGVVHLGWVPDDHGGHRGQMAVLVKPNGLLGRAYMAAIAPFRHHLVYPALMRGLERRWRR